MLLLGYGYGMVYTFNVRRDYWPNYHRLDHLEELPMKIDTKELGQIIRNFSFEVVKFLAGMICMTVRHIWRNGIGR